MLTGAALRKINEGWEFASEVALEDFIWDNLQQLLDFNPLKRQYYVSGEICDILAVSKTKQLAILELKNTEDRYIIQQLTRYYHNLIYEQPLSEQIDYRQPIKLIAIAPMFHRHNLIDRIYNTLEINLLQVNVLQINQNFQLQLKDIHSDKVCSIPILYQELNFTPTSQNIPEIPELFLNWIGACDALEQQAMIKLREKILSFDGRIKEEIEGRITIRYSRGKTKPIAELCYHKIYRKPIIFLWLPIPVMRLDNKQVIGRMRLWVNGETVTYIAHVPEGFGRMKSQSEWDLIPKEKRPKAMRYSRSYKSHYPLPFPNFGSYKNVPNTLESITDLALATWKNRT